LSCSILIEADHDCRDIVTLEDFRKLLLDGESLELCSVEEEEQLRICIAMIEKVRVELSRIVHDVHFFTQNVESVVRPICAIEWLKYDGFTSGGISHLENLSSRLGYGKRIKKRSSSLYVDNKLILSFENNSSSVTTRNSFRKFSYDENVVNFHLQMSDNSFEDSKVKFDSFLKTSESEVLNIDLLKTFLITNKSVSVLHLSNLMDCFSLIPVVVNDAKYIQWLLEISTDYQFLMQTVLAKYSMLKITKSKSILDKPRLNISELIDLRDIVLYCCPISIPEFEDINTLVLDAEAWQKEVYAINGCSPPLTKVLFEALTFRLGGVDVGAVNSLDSFSANKSVPLKKVEVLLSDGEKFPVNFEKEILILKEKKQQAKVWLEKLKRSFESTKIVSSRRSKVSDKDGSVSLPVSVGILPEKLKLCDMKQMVFEGEMLYNTSEENFNNNSKTLNRELDKALNVVESAEDWIERVRELLMADFTSEICDPHTFLNVTDGKEDLNEKTGKKHGQNCLQLQTISFLHTLLNEAEQMPVVMEEASVLRVHLNALEWAAQVRPHIFLSQSKPSALVDLNDLSSDEKRRVKMGRLVGEEEINQYYKPLLYDIQSFANDITKLVNMFIVST
jgi:hypothetical protein